MTRYDALIVFSLALLLCWLVWTWAHFDNGR